MEKSVKNLLKLFTSTFYLSAFTFGGGYVIIPLFKKKFVDELGWLQEEEMLNMAAIAQSSPGPMVVNASILVGWELMGWQGALVAIVGTVLPPLILLSVLSVFYSAFRDNPVVSAVLAGMMAGVSAVIIDVVITMSSKILKEKKVVPIVILVSAFIAHAVFKVNVIYILLFCGFLGALVYTHGRNTGKDLI